MRPDRSQTGLLLLSLVGTALGACGGDPLQARWRNNRTDSAAHAAITTTLEFKGSGFVDTTIVTVFDSNAPANAGCTRTMAVNNGGYTQGPAPASPDQTRMISFNGAGVCTLTVTKCNDRAQNQSAAACPAGMIGLGTVSGTYTVSTDNLTLNLSVGGENFVYSRQ